MTASVTTSSRSVNPRRSAPAVDVSKLSLAPFHAIRAVRLEREARTVAEIHVRIAPRVDWHAFEVAVRVPLARHRRRRRPRHEGLETLLGGRVTAAVQPVEVERLLDALHVRRRL